MQPEVENLCFALERLAVVVESGWTDDRDLNEVHGWNFPAMNRFELAQISRDLSDRIREADLNVEDEAIMNALKRVPQKLEYLIVNTIPQFYNGNGGVAVPIYLGLIDWITRLIKNETSWEIQKDPNAMPKNVARRLRGLSAKVDQLSTDEGEIEGKIKIINEATEAAESLPTDLAELKRAKKDVEKIERETQKVASEMNASKEDVDELIKLITSSKEEADKLVENCGEAYRTTTSKGLAGAFDEKARQLTNSMQMWVSGLVLSLIALGTLGWWRFGEFVSVLSSSNLDWKAVLVHFLLSVVSLGPPLWFAWLSTKQIGQRFRLSEDYAYKASIAKAYEGYRREAARVAPELEKQLLESVMSKLGEAPLRLVEDRSYGSPLHEFAGFQRSLGKGHRQIKKGTEGRSVNCYI